MSSGSRYQPGVACEECRKRKLRCNRQKPKCGTCSDAGIVCIVNTQRQPRGPKRGSLKALRSHIATLEELLLDQKGVDTERHFNREPYIDLTNETTMPVEHNTFGDEDPDQFCNGNSNTQPDGEGDGAGDGEGDGAGDGENPSPELLLLLAQRRTSFSRCTFIPELMGADLDQLYFDRVHSILPIVHKSRYFAWAKQADSAGQYRLCLQNSMWTLAMSLSTQFKSMREALYAETRRMLDAMDLCDNGMDLVHIEQAQAWILVTYYEFLSADYRRGWISSGRVFRLVQLLRLHEVDSPKNTINMASEDVILSEEKRRAFWVAYCLDRFVSVRSGFPLTLNEEVICTRLPGLESEFENGYPMPACFLSEAIASNNNHNQFSPLAECSIMVTLYGRSMSHYQVSTVEAVYGNASQDFWFRHEWINSILTQRLESFSLNYSTVSTHADPMLLFTFMVLQASILYLYKIMEPFGEIEQYKSKVRDYQKRALLAAGEIARLTKEHANIGYFKAHIFMPAAIFLGAERFIIHRTAHQFDLAVDDQDAIHLELQLRVCLDALRNLQSVNNLAKYYLNILESGDIKSYRPY